MAWLIDRPRRASLPGKVLFELACLCVATSVITIAIPALPKWIGFDHFGRHPYEFVVFHLTEAAVWLLLALMMPGRPGRVLPPGSASVPQR